MQLLRCAARLLVAWGNGRTGNLEAGELQCKVSVRYLAFEMGRFQWKCPRCGPRNSHVPERGEKIRTSGQNLTLRRMWTWAACFSAAQRRE
ncbi:hypothetical protein CORC01_14312 [Colletotrichum orchidophilum]|uniref:Uncharacterized protein n=1 Tax=Colletotrichum orchidophilum TaxID=1209926 RepID=A0A1G4AMJ9_9PEZI|nr:uncharacterized protein CORC01_14312 [Colletotrichum orchidophilum]OHE90387.1 hypothetical protein CORC01_14312 [Colletotrichum orchidophilum]